MTVFQPNLDSRFAMGAFAAGLGLDYLSILYGDGLDASRASGMHIDRNDPKLADQLDRIRRTFPWLQLNDYATRLAVVACQPSRCLVAGSAICRGSRSRWTRRGAHIRAAEVMGSISAPAAGAWLGEPMTELRRQFLAGEVDPIRFPDCAACPSLGVPLKKGPTVIPLHPA
jgi:hypothetical protein